VSARDQVDVSAHAPVTASATATRHEQKSTRKRRFEMKISNASTSEVWQPIRAGGLGYLALQFPPTEPGEVSADTARASFGFSQNKTPISQRYIMLVIPKKAS
jgi:hypothetical protein